MRTRERQIRRILRQYGEPMKHNDKWAYRYFYDVRYLLRTLDALRAEIGKPIRTNHLTGETEEDRNGP